MSLTIDQYHLLLQALTLGFGGANKKDLKQLCRLLWVKQEKSLQTEIFDAEFDRYFEQLHLSSSPEKVPHPEKDTPISTPKPTPKTTETSPLGTPTNTEPSRVKIPTALLGSRPKSRRGEITLSSKNVIFNVRDFPVTNRQILQGWRTLSYPIPEGPPTELDIPATLDQIHRQGQLFEPVLRPRRVNRAELLLLIDWDGSMVPFHILARQLADTIKKGWFGKANIYYFRNCPQEYLYLSGNQPEHKRPDDILSTLHKNRTSVFIFSDGGAARCGFNRERIELTQVFLNRLQSKVRSLVWLNPMPKNRWEETTAEQINLLLGDRMYEFNQADLRSAIRAIK